jgi:hypothetical protein
MNQQLVLVDTSGWICFFARKGFRAIKQSIVTLLDENRVATMGIVVMELIQGCRNIEEKERIESNLHGLHWLTVRDEHWHQASQLAFDLRRKGVTASAMDVLIATVCTAYDCQLLHRDRDYQLIARHTDILLFESV